MCVLQEMRSALLTGLSGWHTSLLNGNILVGGVPLVEKQLRTLVVKVMEVKPAVAVKMEMYMVEARVPQ